LKSKAWPLRAARCGVEREQFGGGVAHLLGGLALGLFPLAGAELVQRRGFRVGAA
jgi:hypothetical protein